MVKKPTGNLTEMNKGIKFGLIGLGVVILLAGGYFAWQYFTKPSEAEAESTAQPIAFDDFLKLEPIELPIIQGDAVAKYVVVELSLNFTSL